MKVVFRGIAHTSTYLAGVGCNGLNGWVGMRQYVLLLLQLTVLRTQHFDPEVGIGVLLTVAVVFPCRP